jgi:hypothetical protein
MKTFSFVTISLVYLPVNHWLGPATQRAMPLRCGDALIEALPAATIACASFLGASFLDN